MLNEFLHPQFSSSAETLLRLVGAGLLFVQFVVTVPHARRFFTTERYGGYADSAPFRDLYLNPRVLPLLLAVWGFSLLAIVFDRGTLVAAVVNFAFARYFFVHMRWRGILRGMGAPGHMNQWLSALLLALAIADVLDVHQILRTAVVFTFRLDFALIMIIAGIYKFTAGYPRNEGMERGMVNPYWGYWWKMYKRISPRSKLFALFNHLAYLTEIFAGIMMLIPPLQPWGGLALVLSFIFISANIRLTFLAEVVMACCLLFVNRGDVFDRWISSWLHAPSIHPASGQLAGALALTIAVALYVYAVTLPFAYGAMCYNFYARRSLPNAIQNVVDWWQRFFGLILWRVFTIDVTNFFVNVYEKNDKGERRLLSEIRAFDAARGFRYGHVAEFICLASIFTTLKYFPNDQALFEKRLRRYVRSLPLPTTSAAVFEYVAILKNEQYEFQVVREFEASCDGSLLAERVFHGEYEVRAGASVSPVFAGTTVGTYAPRTR